jgi:hypothetical protein
MDKRLPKYVVFKGDNGKYLQPFYRPLDNPLDNPVNQFMLPPFGFIAEYFGKQIVKNLGEHLF